MNAERVIDSAGTRWIAALTASLVVGLALLAGARSTSAAVGPLPIAGVVASVQGAVDIGPGVAVIVCHVAVDAHVLGIPVVVQANEVGVFLARNPHDYVGACRSPEDGSPSGAVTPGAAVPGQAAVQAGLLDGIGDTVHVVVCATGDGQLFLTPAAAAALVRVDSKVTFGSCAARQPGGVGDGGGGTGSGGQGSTGQGSSGGAATASGALFVNGRVSVPAASLSCGDRLIVTRVATTPRVVRSKKTTVTARFVIVNDQGHLVRGATVWMRSAPLGYVGLSPKKTTATDGSARFALTTTKRLPLKAGGRLVLFVRATLPGRALIGCVTGRRLISLRVSTPTS
jgi:hypothetical protein